MQKLSNVFKEAKKYLWDGTFRVWKSGDGSEEFICHAIERVGKTPLEYRAKEIIQYRLGVNEQGKFRRVTCYLVDVLDVDVLDVDVLDVDVLDVGWSDRRNDSRVQRRIQKYRKDWLTSLEKEFKGLERLFPNGVHHIDGDTDNWDLSNLVGVEKLNNFREI